MDITLQSQYADLFLNKELLHQVESDIRKSFSVVYNKNGAGNDFLGWVDLPSQTSEQLLDDIQHKAAELRSISDVFVVIGIGGSYLGARAVIEALNNHFATLSTNAQTQVVYAGNNISEDYLHDLMEVLDAKNYSVAVISKSGTTTEPAVAFRIIKTHLEKKYGLDEAKKRIVAITDKSRGALKTLADSNGYKTYVVPDDVGGRYSVLTPVGLLPIAVAGIDIKRLMQGAKEMQEYCQKNQSCDNPIAQYASLRHALYLSGKTTEILVSYEPRLYYFSEWWKQLFGESHGKDLKGIFPAAVSFTTDLHSMGQYIQEGIRNLFETVVSVEKSHYKVVIPHAENDLDQLNYIAGRDMNEVNRMAQLGTILAHVDGGVPNIRIVVPEISAFVLGELIYFFEMACALSGYALGVNPFDQPGVEAYKKNMFALLGKKGFEEKTKALLNRLK